VQVDEAPLMTVPLHVHRDMAVRAKGEGNVAVPKPALNGWTRHTILHVNRGAGVPHVVDLYLREVGLLEGLAEVVVDTARVKRLAENCSKYEVMLSPRQNC